MPTKAAIPVQAFAQLRRASRIQPWQLREVWPVIPRQGCMPPVWLASASASAIPVEGDPMRIIDDHWPFIMGELHPGLG